MRISIDERDVTNYLELEQYIKERKYFLRWSEFVAISSIVKRLNPEDIMYHKIIKNDSFVIVWIFRNRFETFYCWTKVGFDKEKKMRHRKMIKTISEVDSLTSLYYYFNERCFLINSQEFYFLTQLLQQWNKENIYLDDCKIKDVLWENLCFPQANVILPSGIDITNQVTARYSVYFKQGSKNTKLDTYVMKYNRFARERKR